MVNWATEIQKRAERRVGELLKEMPKNVGVKGTKKSSATISGPQKVPVMDETPTLEHLGISKNDSSTWQKLAAIPEPEFEARIEACKASGAPGQGREVDGARRAGRRQTADAVGSPAGYGVGCAGYPACAGASLATPNASPVSCNNLLVVRPLFNEQAVIASASRFRDAGRNPSGIPADVSFPHPRQPHSENSQAFFMHR